MFTKLKYYVVCIFDNEISKSFYNILAIHWFISVYFSLYVIFAGIDFVNLFNGIILVDF